MLKLKTHSGFHDLFLKQLMIETKSQNKKQKQK
jgi:hypothetical protein